MSQMLPMLGEPGVEMGREVERGIWFVSPETRCDLSGPVEIPLAQGYVMSVSAILWLEFLK